MSLTNPRDRDPDSSQPPHRLSLVYHASHDCTWRLLHARIGHTTARRSLAHNPRNRPSHPYNCLYSLEVHHAQIGQREAREKAAQCIHQHAI